MRDDKGNLDPEEGEIIADDSGKTKGFGFVSFEDSESAEKAVEREEKLKDKILNIPREE